MSATERLLQHNARYAAGFDRGGLPVSPRHKLAVVACMDARMDLYRLFGLELGDAHVIRNAGGVVTDDVVRSLLISQRLLGTREIVLVHHTDCGMLTIDEDELRTAVYEEVGVRPPFALEAFSNIADNVRRSIALLRASPFLTRTRSLRGFVFDVDSGRLEEVRET